MGYSPGLIVLFSASKLSRVDEVMKRSSRTQIAVSSAHILPGEEHLATLTARILGAQELRTTQRRCEEAPLPTMSEVEEILDHLFAIISPGYCNSQHESFKSTDEHCHF